MSTTAPTLPMLRAPTRWLTMWRAWFSHSLAASLAAFALCGGWASASHADQPQPFTVTAFERFGVTVAAAGPGTVDLGIELPGEVRPNADRTAHLAPRFAGQAREVRADIGQRVHSGDVLAVIVSDTLAPFELRSPIDGVIVDRHLVTGETVNPGAPVFVVADLSSVWIDVNVYQKDLPDVRPGQPVRINAGYGIADAETTINYVSPVLDQGTRTAIARAVVANPDGAWKPGLFVTALVLRPANVPIAVPRTALQMRAGLPLLFVVEGDHFVARAVRLGRLGRTVAEVTAGLSAGERYAATNSFLVKAELEKGEAEE
jgi:membrane fusion protein, heavy metal efflux system